MKIGIFRRQADEFFCRNKIGRNYTINFMGPHEITIMWPTKLQPPWQIISSARMAHEINSNKFVGPRWPTNLLVHGSTNFVGLRLAYEFKPSPYQIQKSGFWFNSQKIHNTFNHNFLIYPIICTIYKHPSKFTSS